MKALVLLSGCGVFDGSEIHESVSTLICLKKNSIDYECTSLDIDMHHVLNYTNGKEINEKRRKANEQYQQLDTMSQWALRQPTPEEAARAAEQLGLGGQQ